MQRRDILKGLRDQWLLFEDGTMWIKSVEYALDVPPENRFQTFVFKKTGAKVRLVDAPGIPVRTPGQLVAADFGMLPRGGSDGV